MADCIYLGDAHGAAGFRLAGIAARVPEPGARAAAVEDALRDHALVLASATVAAALDAARRAELEAALAPRFVVLPDTADVALPDDRLGGVLAQLGVEP